MEHNHDNDFELDIDAVRHIDTHTIFIPAVTYELLRKENEQLKQKNQCLNDLLKRSFSSFEEIMEEFGLNDKELTLLNDIEYLIK